MRVRQICVVPRRPPSEGTCGDATLLFYGLVVAASKYRTLKRDGPFCACKGAFSGDARQNGRRGRSRAAAVSRQTGRSPGRALAELEPPPLRFNALESSTANTSCHAKLALWQALLSLAW